MQGVGEVAFERKKMTANGGIKYRSKTEAKNLPKSDAIVDQQKKLVVNNSRLNE